MPDSLTKAAPRKLVKSDAEWRKALYPEQYRILRREGTERPFTAGNHHDETRDGFYRCAGCGCVLWDARDKFDSGTGWPSFSRPADSEMIATKIDRKLIFARTEVHCATCGGHHGHVFNDGPGPTGLRYCINGAALVFEPAD